MSVGDIAGRAPSAPLAMDRRFYLFMTLWIAALAVIGFAPKSAAILGGALPAPPLIVHLHAMAMVGWLALLVAQAGLVSGGRRDLHMRLGMAAFGLIPAILILGALTTAIRYRDGVEVGAGPIVANILFLQLRFFLMFPLFAIWAIAVRRRDPEMHKRLILLATLLPMGAAFGRMGFIPGNDLAVTNDIASVIELVALAPALAYDLIRFGRLHRAYVIGLAVTLPWLVATHVVWNAPWWKAAADALMGVA